MTIPPLELPDNLPACHEVIRRQHAIIVAQQAQIEAQQRRIEELEARVAELLREVATLRRELYGSRRERFVPEEDSHPKGNAPTAPAEPPAAPLPLPPRDPAPRRTSKGRRKRMLNPSYPREQVFHRLKEEEIPPELRDHPRAKRFFRFVREEVEREPAKVRVIQHYQEVIVLEEDCDTQMLAAQTPRPLIDRCYAGPGLLAYLAASRFADHLPYYREEDILARGGLLISRSTQWRWMRSLAEIVKPLVELMQKRVLESRVMGIDETPIPQRCPDLTQTRTSYLYARYGDARHPYVSFAFASRKTEENARRVIGNFQGYLQSDAYICYQLVTAASDNPIVGVGCWAHARRKFEPLVADGPHPQAEWILCRIQELYDIEDRAKEMSDEQRWELRQAECRPIVEDIKRWLDQRHEQEVPKSPILEGVNYLRNRWEVFTRFLEDGAIPLDNNRTEASLKGPILGRKNWLFFGNDTGGETAAALYTLTMTCKRHWIDVEAYLVDVFRRIRDARPEELEALLPDRWIETHPEARVQRRVAESQAAAARKRQRRARRRATRPAALAQR